MTDKLISVTVCSTTFGVGQGYVLPHWLKSLSVRSRPALCIFNDMLYSDNITPDLRLLHRSYIYGNEINLKWSSEIPKEHRKLCLSFDLKELRRKTRILKKDQATLIVVQLRNPHNANIFDGEGASNDFTIFIGRGTNDREGLQSIPATRVRYQPSVVTEPSSEVKLGIPIKTFHEMMGSFTKCRPEDQIKITFYDSNDSLESGILVTSKSNLNTGTIIEKYGVIPEDAGPAAPANLNLLGSVPAFDERSIVRSQTKVQLVLLDPSVLCLQPNEFTVDSDKIAHLVSFSSLYNEGTVRVYYTPGADLKFSFRFGPYGEEIIYLNHTVGINPDQGAMIKHQ